MKVTNVRSIQSVIGPWHKRIQPSIHAWMHSIRPSMYAWTTWMPSLVCPSMHNSENGPSDVKYSGRITIVWLTFHTESLKHWRGFCLHSNWCLRHEDSNWLNCSTEIGSLCNPVQHLLNQQFHFSSFWVPCTLFNVLCKQGKSWFKEGWGHSVVINMSTNPPPPPPDHNTHCCVC